jgi:hypothetical protein
MVKKPIFDVFRKPPPAFETKGDTTTRVAQEIIKQEATDAAAKLERLRAARVAQEADARAAVKAAPAPRPKRSKA